MKKKILIYNSGGGVGDSIRLFPLILGLQNFFKESEILYLGAHENHFVNKLKEYNVQVESLNINLKYFGFRWWHFFITKKLILQNNIDKFDYVLDLQSKFRNTIVLKQIPTKYFYSSTFNSFFCTNNNLKSFLTNGFEYKKYNIKKIHEKFFNEASRLLPGKNYIGLSITQGNTYRKKSWPLKNFINLANELSRRGKKIVFFVEKSNLEIINTIKEKLPNALFPELESDLSSPALVTALASKLEKAITIDNGVMHMLALADVPMISLFGPTSSKKFAPNISQNDILDSKFLYNSKDISKITIQDVLNLI